MKRMLWWLCQVKEVLDAVGSRVLLVAGAMRGLWWPNLCCNVYDYIYWSTNKTMSTWCDHCNVKSTRPSACPSSLWMRLAPIFDSRCQRHKRVYNHILPKFWLAWAGVVAINDVIRQWQGLCAMHLRSCHWDPDCMHPAPPEIWNQHLYVVFTLPV